MNRNEIILTKDQLLYESVNQTNDTVFTTEDLIKIIKTVELNEWAGPVAINDFIKQIGLQENPNRSQVQIKYSKFATNTIQDKTKNPVVAKKFQTFLEFKSSNPSLPFGSSDTPFIKTGPIGTKNPGIRHAHLTQNISVVYRISGFNPSTLEIYGLFSHRDLGTSNTANSRIQQSIAGVFSKQQFN
jgi:hypothetical protein